MRTVKNFFARKSLGFYFTAATLLCSLLGLIFFKCLTNVSFESTETPVKVIVLAVVVIVLCLATGFKDYFKALSLATLVLSMVTLCSFVTGRVSYFAFYISGDVMDTGLSPFFVLTAVFLLLAVVTSVLAMCFKQEKIIIKEKS